MKCVILFCILHHVDFFLAEKRNTHSCTRLLWSLLRKPLLKYLTMVCCGCLSVMAHRMSILHAYLCFLNWQKWMINWYSFVEGMILFLFHYQTYLCSASVSWDGWQRENTVFHVRRCLNLRCVLGRMPTFHIVAPTPWNIIYSVLRKQQLFEKWMPSDWKEELVSWQLAFCSWCKMLSSYLWHNVVNMLAASYSTCGSGWDDHMAN